MTRTGANQFTARVTGNFKICQDHYRLVLRVPDFPPTRPGQFIQIGCRDLPPHDLTQIDAEPPEIDWSPGSQPDLCDADFAAPVAVLRRPFSLAGRRGDQIDIIHRVVGIGTRFLSTLKTSDEISILGPLGNIFTLPEHDQLAILVGGGVGIPPMIYLASELTHHRAVAFAGALCRDLMPLTVGSAPYQVAEFSNFGIPAILSTDDGSLGFRGFVTQALVEFLDNRLSPEIHRGNEPIIYTCGPEPMMKRVAEIALERNIPCQVAVERAMACGMGTCQSCCIRVRKTDPAKPPLPGKDWCYRLACTDGPIFTAAQLLW
jgi:dihydroorotate dehydrogenase electron transfer subunit